MKMYNLSVTNAAGEILRLTPSTKYIITAIDGLLPPKANVNLSNIAGGDGSEFNSARIESRNIVITIVPNNPVESNRLNLYDFFTPKSHITVNFSNQTRTVYIDGYVESVEGDLFSQRQSLNISILCPQPAFKNAQSIVDEISKTLEMFEFPFSTDEEGVVFSELDDLRTINVVNNGDVPCGAIINIYANGQVQNQVLYSSTSNTHFRILYQMKNGQHIRINSNPRNKAVCLVQADYEESIIGSIDEESTWLTLLPGDNVLTIDAQSGAENMVVRIEHTDQYMGV